MMYIILKTIFIFCIFLQILIVTKLILKMLPFKKKHYQKLTTFLEPLDRMMQYLLDRSIFSSENAELGFYILLLILFYIQRLLLLILEAM